MSDFKDRLGMVRQQLRDKLGLSVAPPSEAAPLSDDSSPSVSVLHRVLEFEDNKQDPEALDSDAIPLPAALSHSLSGTWRQLMLDDGKSAWQRDNRTAASSEVEKETKPVSLQSLQNSGSELQQGSFPHKADQSVSKDNQLLLQLPAVYSLEQAQQQSDTLQLQAYQQTRRLQEAKFLARQAAERLLSNQMQQSGAELDPTDSMQPGIDNGQMQQHIQALRAAQAHMFELSQQVGIAELATELAEARAVFIERNAGPNDLSEAHVSASATSSRSGASQKDSSAGSSCGSTSDKPNRSGNLGSMKLDLLSEAARLQHLSSSLTYTDLPQAPACTPVTPREESSSSSLHFMPATPSVSAAPVRSSETPQSSAQDDAATHDISAAGQRLGAGANCDSISGYAQADTENTAASGKTAEGEICSILPPLPELPGVNQGDSQKVKDTSMRYIQIGCALAGLCAVALWARDPSNHWISTRIFPT